jgi:hypothetical protein
MTRLWVFELAVGSLALVGAVSAYLAAPGSLAFFAAVFAAAAWTVLVVEILGRAR